MHGNLQENGTYLGAPLVIIAACLAIAYWRKPVTAISGLLAVVSYALSLGTALAVGEVRTLAGIAVLVVAFWRKILKEERLLAGLFGPAWQDYCRSTRAVIPWVV